MEPDEMRALVKRICNVASKSAAKSGYNIDFEKSLYLKSTGNTYMMCDASDIVDNVVVLDGNDDFVHLGALFTSYVPPFDRLQYIDHSTLEKSPVGSLYLKELMSHAPPVMLPIADEFAYRFPDIAMKMILEKLMSREIYACITNPDKGRGIKLLKQEDMRFMEEVAKYKREIKASNKSLGKKSGMTSQLMQKGIDISNTHAENMSRIRSTMKPIKIPIMPKACKTYDELGILLDFYDI